MIHKLTLRNFKGIESADLSFERFTVLVGPNASGKTSVLQALDLLSAVAKPETKRGAIFQRYGGPSAIKRGGATDLLVEASGQWMRKSGMLGMVLNASAPHELKVHSQWEGQTFEVEPQTAASNGFRRGMMNSSEEAEPSPHFSKGGSKGQVA